MAYTYLSVTNKVLSRFNEVELTSANFNNSRGFQTQCKNAVNDAIRYINQNQFIWPFNHQEHTETLVVNQTRYNLPPNTKLIDYETFRLMKDDTLNTDGRSLKVLDYKEYIDKFAFKEDTTEFADEPTHVFRDPANNFGVYPYPDQAYQVKFDYYTYPTTLVSYTDVPSIPERFEHVLIDGAVMYGYLFRGEQAQYQLNRERFEDGIENMRTLLSNRTDYVRSTYRPRQHLIGTAGFR